jgi:hypothetical protein
MGVVTASAPDLIERYGRPSRTRRPLVVAVAGLLAVVGLGWLVWTSVEHSRPEVSSQLVGYGVRGDHAVTASFTVVRRDTGVRATCLLRALAADHAVVGELNVPVTSGPLTARVESTVRTERRADSVDLIGCTADGRPAGG